MALSREEAENHGLAFSVEGERYDSDPDQEVFLADITIDGHTSIFSGKSEDDILAAAENLLRASGRIEPSEKLVFDVRPHPAGQDVR